MTAAITGDSVHWFENDGTESFGLDYGAQYFTARDKRFCRFVNSWIHDGIVQPWMGRIVQLSQDGSVIDEKSGKPRYVGVPSMSAVADHLAKDVTVHLNHRLSRLIPQGEKWCLEFEDRRDDDAFDVILLSCPPAQASELVAGHTGLHSHLPKVKLLPCWAVTACDRNLNELPFDAAFVDEHPISWIARDGRKPGRGNRDSAVIHASATWSEAHRSEAPRHVAEQLTEAFRSLTRIRLSETASLTAHFWPHALPATPIDQDHLFDRIAGIGLCGDWCGGSRVESAFLSGAALAGAVLRRYTIDRPSQMRKTEKDLLQSPLGGS